jgi:hypothetical protein
MMGGISEPSFSLNAEAAEHAAAKERTDPEPSDESMEDVLDAFEAHETREPEEDVLDAFEEAPNPPPENTGSKSDPSRAVSLDGHAKVGSSWNYAHKAPPKGETDWRNLSRLRAELQLELEARLAGSWKTFASGKGAYDAAYAIQGRDNFTDEVLDNYEKEIELRELYLMGSIAGNMDLKVGRQIVVWGRSDNIRVTDVLNPLDMREPGLTDIEDLRLPVTMTRLDYYFGKWNLSALAVHEIRFNKMPEFGSDFYPYGVSKIPENSPESRIDNTEFGLAFNGVFSGWDISFYYASVFDDYPHAELVSAGMFPHMELHHSDIHMGGTAGNIALGNWLIKTDIAFFDGMQFLNTGKTTFSRIDVLAGMEYSGFADTTVTIEAVNRRLTEYDRRLKKLPDKIDRDDFQSVLRITKDYFHDTLTVTLLTSLYGFSGQNGAFGRFSLEYDLSDNWTILGGIVDYHSGDKPSMSGIGDNDRIYGEIKYSF